MANPLWRTLLGGQALNAQPMSNPLENDMAIVRPISCRKATHALSFNIFFWNLPSDIHGTHLLLKLLSFQQKIEVVKILFRCFIIRI